VVWTRASYAKFYSHVVSALQTLGYRARLRLVPDREYYGALRKAGKRVQAGYVGFFATPDGAGSFIEGTLGFLNESTSFADAVVARQIRRARKLQQTDPAAANELWASSDRLVVDRAPVVPMYDLRSLVLVSERVGNFQYHAVWFTLLDQVWVRRSASAASDTLDGPNAGRGSSVGRAHG
jgi:ABC-type transport system substrate-binding protein